MKIRLTIYLSFILLAASVNVAAQTNFESFWENFKAAIAKGDKNAVAGMSKFPLNMPYGVDSVKNKAAFLKRYKEIFDGDVNAAKSFPKAKPFKENAKSYSVYCPFKTTPEDFENAPNNYYFVLTKTGWKFAGLDNINE